MFPVKIGNEIDVKPYSESLIKGEKQLLVTVEGNIFITNGDGTYKEFKGNDVDIKLEELKNTLIFLLDEKYEEIGNGFNNDLSEVKADIQALILSIATITAEIEKLEDKIYTKDEIDEMKIPASRITVDVTQDGVNKTITLQEAMDYMFNNLNPKPPEEKKAICGDFKVGEVTCGENIKYPVCGTFNSGELTCGYKKPICGNFNVGDLTCGS